MVHFPSAEELLEVSIAASRDDSDGRVPATGFEEEEEEDAA